MRKRVIALLLICFAFFIVHDYVFEYIDPCNKSVACAATTYHQSDTLCQIHIQMHNALFFIEQLQIFATTLKKEPIFYQKPLYHEFHPNSIFHPPALFVS